MSSGDAHLELDQQLCFALYSASRALVRAYGPLLAPLGLTYPQYLVMLVLWEGEGISVKRLGDRLGLDSGTLTPLLKRLEKQKLLVRLRDERDERVVRLGLTDDGRALRTKARRIPVALGCRAGFDVTDKQALKRLERLREELFGLVETLEAG